MNKAAALISKSVLLRKWRSDVNAILSKKSRISAAGQIFLAALAAYSLSDFEFGHGDHFAISALIAINLARVFFTFRPSLQENEKVWIVVFFGMTLTTAALWSYLCILCLDHYSIHNVHTLHMLTLLAGVAASASSGLSPHRPMAWSFLFISLGPVIVKLGQMGTSDHIITLSIISSYLIFLISQVELQTRTINELFSRRDHDRALFDSSFEGIVMHEQGVILEANESFEKLFGAKRGEMHGRSAYDLIHPEDLVHAQKHSGGGDDSYIARATRLNGDVFWIEVRGRTIMFEGRRVRLACAQDISERIKIKNAELDRIQKDKEILELREKTAIESSRLKSQFLANMSHEIRTPMNAIIAISELLQSEKFTAEGKRFLRTLRESSESLLALINDILDYSKIEAGALELETAKFDLAELVESQTDLLVGRAKQKNIALRCHVDPLLPLLVVGDYGRIKQVLLNLIGNAIKFTPAGEVQVRCLNLRSDFGPQVTRVRFEVQDSGCGISADQGQRLFQPFVQGDSSTARRHGGTGLGLSISKNLVEVMGGSIGYESDGMSYTTFWFEIPLQSEDMRTIGETYRKSGDGARECLILKESLPNWSTISAYVRSWGYHVREAEAYSDHIDLKTPDFIVVSNSVSHSIPLNVREKTLAVSTSMNAEEVAARGTTMLPSNVRISDLYNAVLAIVPIDFGTQVVSLAKSAEKTPPTSFHNCKVLIAEDNSTNQLVILALLKRFGIEGVLAKNGAEAVAEFQRQNFDLVLMDCQMPEVDGLEATSRIRQTEKTLIGSHVPIVALTANATNEDRAACLASGMDDFLSKPIRSSKLAEILNHFLSEKSGENKRMIS